MLRILPATSAAHIEAVRRLFREYADGIDGDICFQEFDRELSGLPGAYGPPRGRLLLALDDEQPCGCVGLRPHGEDAAEMKRLYVRASARGRGLGRQLALEVLRQAASLGYTRVVLDTLPSMQAARVLYASLGFTVVPAPEGVPDDGRIFMEIGLPRSVEKGETPPDE